MKALRIHRPGGADGLVYENAPDPEPVTGDVLVEVRAAGFTPNELDWSATWIDRAGRDRTPSIPAHEVSGVVVAVGFGTSGFEVGDEVYGLTDSLTQSFDDQDVASGMASTTQQVGGAVGLAILIGIANSGTTTDGLQAALLAVAAGIVLTLIAALRFRRPAH